MTATTRSVAAMLTCIACASSVAAQAPNNQERAAQQELRQQERRAAQAQAQAQRGTGARGRSTRGATAEASESFLRTVPLVSGGTFELQSGTGDVTITGGGGRNARIEATRRVRGTSDARVRTMLDAIRIDERGGNVEVRTLRQRGLGNATVDYTITLPENVNVILRSASGNLSVLRMAGDELRMNTLSGKIVVRELKGRMLDLHTVSGNMLLQDIAAQHAVLESMAGNLEYAGRLQPTGRYQFQTHRGDIRVTPFGNPGFDLEAMTFKGNLRSDFVLTLLRRPRPVERQRAQKTLRGTVGDAGAMVTASSFSGNIFLIKP